MKRSYFTYLEETYGITFEELRDICRPKPFKLTLERFDVNEKIDLTKQTFL